MDHSNGVNSTKSPKLNGYASGQEPEIDLREVVNELLQKWKLILGSSLGCGLIAALISFFLLTPQFESSATLMSPVDNSTRASMRALAGSSPFAGLLNLSVPASEMNRYLEILQSRGLIAELVQRENLAEYFDGDYEKGASLTAKQEELLIREVRSSTELELTREGVLRLAFRHPHAELAQRVVTTYLDLLQDTIVSGASTQVKATELFIAERLQEAKSDLEKTEAELIALQKNKGVIQLSSQAQLSLSTVANLRAQLIEKEMEIAMYRDILKDSAEIRRLESEKRQIEEQIRRLTKTTNTGNQKKQSVEVFTPLGDVPMLEVTFATAQREYLTQVKLLELLTQQYEMARIESKRSEPMFQVIDYPVVGAIQVAPNKTLNTLLGLFLGGFLSIFILFFRTSSFRDDHVQAQQQIFIKTDSDVQRQIREV